MGQANYTIIQYNAQFLNTPKTQLVRFDIYVYFCMVYIYILYIYIFCDSERCLYEHVLSVSNNYIIIKRYLNIYVVNICE